MDIEESICNINNSNTNNNNDVGYIFNNKLVAELNKIEQISGRVRFILASNKVQKLIKKLILKAERVNSLIKSYNLFEHLKYYFLIILNILNVKLIIV